MATTETKLASDIKNGIIFPVYYLYGKETFLTRTYAEKIKAKTVGKEPIDFNCLTLRDNPDPQLISEFTECMPLFSDKKIAVINDLNPETMDDKTLNGYIDVLNTLPDTAVVVIYITGFEPQLKKSATKKLVTAIEKIGCVCELKPLSPMKVAQLISKKVSGAKRLISQQNAEYLAEITMCDLTLASEETAKLCTYANENEEISRETIDKLVVKHPDTKIYYLANAITAGDRSKAFEILEELFEQRVDFAPIMATLAGAFTDFYRAKLGKEAGISPQQAAADFDYKKNREWLVSKNYTAVSKIKLSYLRNCLAILSEADIKLKSTAVNSKTFIEQTVVKLMEK